MKKLLVLTAVAALVATTAVEAHDDHPVGALKFFGRRLLERRGRCCSWLHGGQRGLRCSD